MKKFLNKNKEALGGVIIIVIAFYCGKYSAPERIKTEIKVVEVEKEVKKSEHKTIKIKQNKDGSKETIIISDTNTEEKSKEKTTEEKKEIIRNAKTNISLLVGGAYPISGPHYGLSVQRQLIGPITLGAWGTTNNNFGLSIGLNF
jgi:23S rRNA pseudoU1915 N3-methylase RlmH